MWKGINCQRFQKSSILSVNFCSQKSILWVKISRRKNHYSLSQKIFVKHSLSHAKNGVIFFDSCWKEGFNFYESYSSKKKKRFNSVSHVLKRSSILWVMSRKVNNFWVIFLRKGSILWVKKEKRPNSPSHKNFWLLESNNLLGSNFLSPFVQKVQSIESNSWKRSINSLSHVQKVEVFESCKKKVLKSLILVRRVHFFESYPRKRFNSLNFFEQKVTSEKILCVMLFKRSSILGVGKINSLNYSRFKYGSHIKESSILWVQLNQKAQFFALCWKKELNSLSHVKKFNSLSHTEKKVQFFQLCKKRFNSLSPVKKVQFFDCFFGEKVQFFWVVFKVFNSFSRIQRKCSFLWVTREKQSFGSYQKKGSILRVTCWVICSIL